jgi:hypothetical protein
VDYKNNTNVRDIRAAARVARRQEGIAALVAAAIAPDPDQDEINVRQQHRRLLQVMDPGCGSTWSMLSLLSWMI